MYGLLTDTQKAQKEHDRESYLANFERMIDPIIVGALYGLYRSFELPPLDVDQITLDKEWEFNVDIRDFSDIMNHLLFCLWVKKEGSPGEGSDIVKYRQELYAFIDKLLRPEYYRDVLIPFYINEATKGETSFLHRLWSSDKVKFEMIDYSPEYLAAEFSLLQKEFVAYITNTPGKESKPVIGSLTSSSELLKHFENALRFFIGETLQTALGTNWWKQTVPQDVRANCENRKPKGKTSTGEDDYPLLYYADFDDYYKIITKKDNWRRYFSRTFGPDEAWIKTKLLLELGPIRNDIAHNRELSREAPQRLRDVTKEILSRMKKP
jgi:hypothetical protein